MERHGTADCGQGGTKFPELIRQAEQLLAKSQLDDQRQFFAHWEYIDTRLRQMAFDRKFGSYRSFAEAIVNSRPDIKLAAQILTRGKT